ncbi:MAG: amidohydrolase family protein [Ruthenibacterium sp.]
MELFDAHMHFAPSHGEAAFDAIRAAAHIKRCTLQCIAQYGIVSTVPAALRYKAAHNLKCPGSVYVMGGLERSAYVLCSGDALAQSLAAQAKALLAAGCDGIKLLEGKPDIRRNFPIPDFDAPEWEPFWCYAEQARVPVTLHLNDPEEFWDASKLNPYAKSEGWFYGPETINNEEQYRQMDAVLARHPQLALQLAHFYFFSAQLPRLTALLRAYPNVRIDLTPGIELYTNLAQNLSAAREFFAEFGTRILYGSDIGSRAGIANPPRAIDPDESLARVAVIRTFLESTGAYTLIPDGKYLFRIEPTPMQGLGLSTDALAAIYGGNALAFYDKKAPAPVDENAVQHLADSFAQGVRAVQAKGLFPDAVFS